MKKLMQSKESTSLHSKTLGNCSHLLQQILDNDQENGGSFVVKRITSQKRKRPQLIPKAKGIHVHCAKSAGNTGKTQPIRSRSKQRKKACESSDASSLNSLLDRCPGGVASKAINSPLPPKPKAHISHKEVFRTASCNVTNHPRCSACSQASSSLQSDNLTYYQAKPTPFNKRLATSTPNNARVQTRYDFTARDKEQGHDTDQQSLDELISGFNSDKLRPDTQAKAQYRLVDEIPTKDVSVHAAKRIKQPAATTSNTIDVIQQGPLDQHPTLDTVSDLWPPDRIDTTQPLDAINPVMLHASKNVTLDQSQQLDVASGVDAADSKALIAASSPSDDVGREKAGSACTHDTDSRPTAHSKCASVSTQCNGSRVTDIRSTAVSAGVPSADSQHTRTDLHTAQAQCGVQHRIVVNAARHVNNNLYGLRDAVAVYNNDQVDELIRDIDQSVVKLITEIGVLDWQTELDLALQPLRSENAQLRRRIRILNQQLRDVDMHKGESTAGDLSFEVIHTKLLLESCEKQLQDCKATNEQLQCSIQLLTAEKEQLCKDKVVLLQLLEKKDKSQVTSNDSWGSEVERLQRELESVEGLQSRMTEQVSKYQRELEISRINCDVKEREVQRLQALVRSLQNKMDRLVLDLREAPPHKESFTLSSFLTTIPSGLTSPNTRHTTESNTCATEDVLTEAALKEHDKCYAPLHDGAKAHGYAVNSPQSTTTSTSQPRLYSALNHNASTSHSKGCGTPKNSITTSLSAKYGIPQHSASITFTSTQSSFSPSPTTLSLTHDQQKIMSSENIAPSTETGDETLTDYCEPQMLRVKSDQSVTVGEFLGPYAEQMNITPLKLESTLDTNPDSVAAIDVTKSRAQKNANAGAIPKTKADDMSSVSRFSINDYFKKYKTFNDNLSITNGPTECENVEDIALEDLDNATPTIDRRKGDKTVDEGQLTVLSHDTSTLTVTTSDENAFKEGLASLDANIARIQQSLKNIQM